MEAITNEYTSQERKPIIDEGLRDLLPALSDEAYEALTLDILQNGCYSPMICMEDMTLVDGHNRYAICEENDIPYRMVVLPFGDKLAAKQWALDTQKARRNLTTCELGQIALKLKPKIEARAKERMSTGGGDKRSDDIRSGMATLPYPIQETGSTRKELADAAGIGERTMGKIMKIEEEAPEPIKEAVEKSDISINKGYQLTQKLRELPEDTVKSININKYYDTSNPAKVTMQDKQLALEFAKTDEMTGTLLDGCTFTLYDSSGNTIKLRKISDGVYKPDTSGNDTFTTKTEKLPLAQFRRAHIRLRRLLPRRDTPRVKMCPLR